MVFRITIKRLGPGEIAPRKKTVLAARMASQAKSMPSGWNHTS
jgi:hypothetical protein